MLLCQLEMQALDSVEDKPSYYIVGCYGFDPDLQVDEEVWINWQVLERTFEIPAKVIRRRKEVHVDGKRIVLNMSDREKATFTAIYPNGLQTLSEGANLFLLRIFLEAKDKETLFKIQEAIARSGKRLAAQKQLPEPSE